MLITGGLLLIGGLVLALTIGSEAPGGWLLPLGMTTGGVGILVAGALARMRRRLALVRGVTRAHRAVPEGGPLRRLHAVPRMIAATARGRNPLLPRYQALLWLVAAVYLVWPLDFVPDFLPLLGIGDDIGVGAWLFTSLYAEAGNYLTRTAPPDTDGSSDGAE